MPSVELMAQKEAEEVKPYWVQDEKSRNIVGAIWKEFDRYKSNRNRLFSNFRERDPIEYWNDSEQRFNNYREKPDWKEDWNANISDITTHSKLMAIAAQIVAYRMRVEFSPRFTRDFYSSLKAQILQDLYEFTDTAYRNGDLDDLFTIIHTAKFGTCIGFEGWKKTKTYEGIDAQFIPLEDFYPQYINKFRMEDQGKAIWRTIYSKDDFDMEFPVSKFPNAAHVIQRGSLTPDDLRFFSVSDNLDQDEVEILRWFNKDDNEFHIIANGVLLTKEGSKLSDYRKDGEMGFWKAVYEPFGYDFFYGRSLPDLMSDNQDAIDFLFNAMFDQTMLATLKPIFSTGINNLTDDYLKPGKVYNINDATGIYEPKITGPDAVAFSILTELKQRQDFVSVDKTLQGSAVGNRTAHEVERAVESAQKIVSLFSVLLSDALKQKGKLRAGTMLQFMITSKSLKPIIIESTKLFNGREGTRILRIKDEKSLTPKNQFGFSPKLMLENAQAKGERSEIIEFTPEQIQNLEYMVNVRTPSTVEMSASLQKTFDERFATIAFSRPDLYDQKEAARKYAQSMNQNPDEVLSNEEVEQSGVLEQMMAGKTAKLGSAPASPTPLKSLI